MAERYVEVLDRAHPRAHVNGCVLEHVAIAEKALGRPLPPRVEIHHVNEVKSDNRPENLVICENAAYHGLLHVRARVLRAGGRPGLDKICGKCRAVKPRTEFSPNPSDKTDGLDNRCRACRRKPKSTTCRRGHPWTPETTYIRPDKGTRVCRACTGHQPQKRREESE